MAQAFINLWPRTKHALDASRRVLRRCFSIKLTSCQGCLLLLSPHLQSTSIHQSSVVVLPNERSIIFAALQAARPKKRHAPNHRWVCAGLSVTGLYSRQLTRVFSAFGNASYSTGLLLLLPSLNGVFHGVNWRFQTGSIPVSVFTFQRLAKRTDRKPDEKHDFSGVKKNRKVPGFRIRRCLL